MGSQAEKHINISGVMPHLAVKAGHLPARSEIGIGALMPWADRLWFELYGLARREAGQKVSLFLSLQGASARIRAARRLVYCHQNMPLATMSWPPPRRAQRPFRQIYVSLPSFPL